MNHDDQQNALERRKRRTSVSMSMSSFMTLFMMSFLLLRGVSSFVVPLPGALTNHRRYPLFVQKASSSADTSNQSRSTTASRDNNKQRANNNRRPNNDRNNNRNSKRTNDNNDNQLNKQKKLNRMIVESETPAELFKILQETSGALTKNAGGGVLNTVNFSTAIHRLARHSLQPRARPGILADPRLALLMAAMAEAIGTQPFSSREISNIAWALAKLRIAPPASAMPLSTCDEDQLSQGAQELRLQVVQASKAAKQSGQALQPTWVPKLSQLAGWIVDHIAMQTEKRTDLKQQELSNLLWSWATADRANPVVFDRLMHRMMQPEAEERNPQEWSNAVWAFATARVYHGHEEMLDFLANLLDDESFVEKFKCQEISNTIWGTATLLSNMEGDIPHATTQSVLKIFRKFVPHILSKINHFKSQELSNTLWGMATCGFGVNSNADLLLVNGYVFLPTESPQLDQNLKNEVVQVVVAAASEKLHQFKSQELNNVAWSLARLLDPGTPWIHSLLHGIGMELSNPRRRVTSQDIGTTLWAFATLEFFDDKLYRAIISKFTPEYVQTCKAQELSNSLWAIATAEIDVGPEKDAFDTTLLSDDIRPVPRDPITSFFGDAAYELIRRPDDFKSQELKDFLWGTSKLSIRHPKLFRRTAEHLVGREDEGYAVARGLGEFSPQGLGNMAWAFARQAQLAEDVTERYKNTLAVTLGSSGRLAFKKACLADLGDGLTDKFFFEIAEADLRAHNNLSDLRPQDLSNTIWTFGVLSICHKEFTEACKNQLKERIKLYLSGQENVMTYFKGQEISNLLWSLATLNTSPDGILDSVGEYLKRISRDNAGKLSLKGIASAFKRQELANIAWASAVFGTYPNDLMTFLYGGLLGNHKNPKNLDKMYGDEGLQSQAAMTLLYVQAAMELSGNPSGLALPPNFPEDWKPNSESSKGDYSAPTVELTLSTSKTQSSVSAAFQRIGFEHVEEHVITMEALSSQYGINIAPKNVEVLSIDIADLSNQIAIEVEGPSHYITTLFGEGVSTGYTQVTQDGKMEYNFAWTGDRQFINGSTKLKERLLESLGWKVVHLPYWEWSDLRSEQAEEEYCRNLLNRLR